MTRPVAALPVQRSLLGVLLALTAVFALASMAHAQFEMPDPKQMSGIPRPVTDLPNGSVSVRVIRGDLSNNVAGQPVELHVGDKVQTVKTDENGRAQFDKLPTGAVVKSVTVVDGERLESQEFPVPGQGGIRLMLVATDKEKEARKAAEASAPPIAGTVVLGGESRIVIEPGDESLSVYYLLDIMNNARAPVNPPAPFIFDMPTGMTGTAILQGSSKLATANGTHIRVAGPFPPGKTQVEVGGEMPVWSDSIDMAIKFPALFEQPVVIAKKEGNLKLVSPQLDRQQESAAEGATIIVAAGNALQPGQTLSLSVSGLPHHSPVPRRVALTLSALIAVIGVWFATRSPDPIAQSAERKRLVARREKLLQDLVRIEQDHRRGKLDQAHYASKREDVLASLEQIYGALDTEEGGPEPSDRGDRGRVGAPLGELKAS